MSYLKVMNESFTFLLLNTGIQALEILGFPPAEETRTIIMPIFKKYYEMTNKISKQIEKSINTFNKTNNEYEALDFEIVRDNWTKLPKNKTSVLSKNYGEILKIFLNKLDIITKTHTFSLPLLIDNKYLILISFDQDKIYQIGLLVTHNSYDAQSFMTAFGDITYEILPDTDKIKQELKKK